MPTFIEVSQWSETAVDSTRKKTVEVTMEMEMIQKEIATASFGSRKPCFTSLELNVTVS